MRVAAPGGGGAPVYGSFRDGLRARLAEARASGTYKDELLITTPQAAHVAVEGDGPASSSTSAPITTSVSPIIPI